MKFGAKYPQFIGLSLVLVIYCFLAVLTNWRAPLSVGPDEVAHFMLARFLEKENRLPLTLEDRRVAGYKSDQPPLNAVLVAAAFFQGGLNSPPFLKLTHNVPRRHLVTGPDNVANWQVINTEDPITGEILLWRVGRFLSTLFSLVTLIVIYFLALLIFEHMPNRELWALSTVVSLAFIPTFVFMSAMFNYENLLGMWLSFYLLVTVYVIKTDNEAWWWYVVAGLLVGLAIATKLGALPALLSLVGVVILVTYRARWSKRKLLAHLALTIVGVLIGAGWWFGLMVVKFNQVDELGWIHGLLQPIVVADGSDITSVKIAYLVSDGKMGNLVETPDSLNFSDWAGRMFRTFWRWQWQNQERVFRGLAWVSILIFLGLAKAWYQKRTARLWITVLSVYAILFFILPFIRLLLTQQTTPTGQGQHILFPAAGAFAVLITWGLGTWFPTRWQWAGGMLLGLGMLGWSIFQAIQIYQPPLPVRTVSPVLSSSATSVEADFGPMTLMGYELHGFADAAISYDPARPALGVNLYWLAEELAIADYLTEIRLVDSSREAQTGWVGYAANGRYPTRAWEPGDFIRDEIWLPLPGLASGEYSLTLRLWGQQQVKEPLILGQVKLMEISPGPNESVTADNPVFKLWRQGQIVQGIPSFESRSTIQITTNDKVNLKLVGPDELVREPVAVVGHTHIFIVDLLWPRGEYRLRIQPETQPAQESPPVLVAWGEGRQTDVPASQITVNANFADQLVLLGYTLFMPEVAPGDKLPIVLNWQALRTMPADFIMFTRLLDETGRVWGGYDRKPREAYSTLLWAEGEVVEDGFTIQVDSGAPDGIYYLDIGFYLPIGAAPVALPLVQDGQMSDVTRVTIGPIEVKQPVQ